MFVEQLIVKRNKDVLGSWDPPISQSLPIDSTINIWVDSTGNEIVSVTPPSMFMQWMDVERTTRLVVCAVMVTYIPAVIPPMPLTQLKEVEDDKISDRKWG